jgi:hypothetical protein
MQPAELAPHSAKTEQLHCDAIACTVLLEHTNPICIRMEAICTEYGDAAITDETMCDKLSASGYNSPHHHVWATMITTLLAIDFPEFVAQQHINLLRLHDAATVERPRQLEEFINICMISRTYNGLHSKITLEVTTEIKPIFTSVLYLLTVCGARVLHGPPLRRVPRSRR